MLGDLLIPLLVVIIIVLIMTILWLMWRSKLREGTYKKIIDVYSLVNGSIVRRDWTTIAMGESGSIELEKAWLRMAQRLFEMFVNKNHDYGTENLAMGGTLGIALRMGDKVSRLWQLNGLIGDGKQRVVGENQVDTMMDLANYGITGAIMADGSWPKAFIKQVLGRDALTRLVGEFLATMTEEERVRVTEFYKAYTMAEDMGGSVIWNPVTDVNSEK